jgi:hypothetical protein
MLTTTTGLLVSLPARELAGICPSGSLFKDAELGDAVLSDELRSALEVARQFCSARKMPLLFVARPEIFTHGESLQWLKDRLGRVKDHLCISDGSAIRPIPQMRNHLFLYRLGIHDNAAAFHRLMHCAPELLRSMQSQVNTCMSAGRAQKLICPPPVLLQATRPKAKTPAPRFYRYKHHPTLATAVAKTLKSQLPAGLKSLGCERLSYFPMTETACKDRSFAKVVAEAFSRSRADGKFGCVVRIPKLAETASWENRLESALQAIHPHISTKSSSLASHSVIFTTEDLSTVGLASSDCSIDLIMHSSFEFWSHPKPYYESFQGLNVYGLRASDQDQVALQKLLVPAFRRRPELHQLRADRNIARDSKADSPRRKTALG